MKISFRCVATNKILSLSDLSFSESDDMEYRINAKCKCHNRNSRLVNQVDMVEQRDDGNIYWAGEGP